MQFSTKITITAKKRFASTRTSAVLAGASAPQTVLECLHLQNGIFYPCDTNNYYL
jgi:hypothetical protein